VAWGLAAVLAAAAGPVAAAPSVTGLDVRPGHFTPNGDGRTDTAEVSFVPGGDADSVGVRIEVRRVAGDVLVGVPRPLSPAPAGDRVEQVWDPGPILEGTYRFDVAVFDGADSVVASALVVADTTAPDVTLGALVPNPFDPASDPPANLLHVPFTVATDSSTVTWLRVRGASGAVVDTLGSWTGPGSGEVAWDGKASDGRAVASGVFSVRAIATDRAGNADTTSQSFTLDQEGPVLAALADSLQTDTLPIAIGGSIVDVDRVVAVETSADSGATWLPADSLSAPGPSVTWSTSVTFPSVTPGFHRLRVRARDAFGHTTRDSLVVAYDTQIPAPISSTVLGDGRVADGEVLRIRTEWTMPGLHVTANLSDVDFGWTPGAETVTEGPAASYLIEYRVTPSNVRRAEGKTVVIRASTGIVAATDTVSVILEEGGPVGAELVAISRNRFDPDARETVTIAGDRPSIALRVRVANLAGQVVRELEGSGSVEWDGRSTDGRTCGSGVYVLRVQADEDVEVRRVAILRGGGS